MMQRTLIALLLCSAVGRSEARIVGAAVLPHGDFVYDPSLVHNQNGSLELHEAAVKVGKWLTEEVDPDVVILTTPHGMELQTRYLMYMNQNETGFASLGDDLHNTSTLSYKVFMNASVDVPTATRLLSVLPNTDGVKGFAGGMTLPISWGEIIPLSFLNDKLRSSTVLIGMPLSRYNHSVEMVPELLEVGAALFDALDAEEKTYAVIISSDLAHTHLASGPYGYCPCAEPYDQAVGKWAREQSRSALLEDAAKQQGLGAMSCGFTGLVLLEGVLAKAQWRSQNLANFHPTYYGMMVANFSRI